jgi:hypothetical protein
MSASTHSIDFFPVQQRALEHLKVDSPVRVVLFGGAAGGSKSFLGCAWQIMRRIKYAGSRGLIGRSKLDTLKKTTLNTFFEVAAMFGLRSGVHYTFNGQSNIIYFENGSEIILKDLFAYPSDPNFDSLGSLEITDFFIDEVAQVSERAVSVVRSRVRYKLNEFGLQPKGLMTCNPSKGWLYNKIYKPWVEGVLDPKFAFVPALPGDNPKLPESYLEELASLPEQLRKRLLDGDWDYDESIDVMFKTDDVLRCFRNELLSGEKRITADIARLGQDRTVIGVWDGLTLIDIRVLTRVDITVTIEAIRELMAAHKVSLKSVLVDEDGIGGGVKDIMKCLGFVNGSKATQPQYMNLKSECYYKLADLIEKGKVTMLVANDYKDKIAAELDMIRRENVDKDGKLAVTPKDKIKLRHGISPDFADMLMMRAYFELKPNYGKYSFV